MNLTALTRFAEHVREYFLLEKAERASAARTIEQRETVRTSRGAASARLCVARDLRGPSEIGAALTLYREGLRLLVFAFLASRRGEVDPASLQPAEVAVRLKLALADEASVPPPLLLDEARLAWPSSNSFEIDSLAVDEAGRLADELQAATQWLLDRVEGRGPREIAVARVARIATVGAAALALVVWLFSAKNLAAGKPATSSSVAESTIPHGAVDGSKNGRFGFHSGEEDGPWWAVDLGKTTAIAKIKVFGRGDCCFDQSIPLGLEVSDDGASFRQVALRTTPFSESDPWIVNALSIEARFVRLRTLRRSYLVLGEVEVYGGDPGKRSAK